jgi:hypothetical protein
MPTNLIDVRPNITCRTRVPGCIPYTAVPVVAFEDLQIGGLEDRFAEEVDGLDYARGAGADDDAEAVVDLGHGVKVGLGGREEGREGGRI